MVNQNNIKQYPTTEGGTPLHSPKTLIIGDMPGDKIQISDDHLKKADLIYKELMEPLTKALTASPAKRAVLTVCGGSGVGKSEIASVLAGYLHESKIGTYTLSGDNYPHRIPQYNDAERVRIFNVGGLQGLVTSGHYNAAIKKDLCTLQLNETDSSPALIAQYPWLALYQEAGRNALKAYLGTPCEQDFAQLTSIISQFKNNAQSIWLKRMGRTPEDIWYENVDFSKVNVIIIEWTHGNSDNFCGVDIPILLNSTPEETRQHRRARNRDGKTDSFFTQMVLELEQHLIEAQAPKAKIIVSKNGEIQSFSDYCRLMNE